MKIERVYYDQTCEHGGCETCDYGSNYLSEITIKIDGRTFNIQINHMYNWFRESDLMQFLCRNVEKTENIDEFIKLIREDVEGLAQAAVADIYGITVEEVKDNV